MRSRGVWIVIVAILGMLGAAPAFAQIGQGRLTGTVTDTQGAVLPGVTVTATSPALIGVRTTVTEADGKYLFPALPSGTYKLTFELSGFRRIERDNVVVVLGQTISVDAQMQIGGLAENVTVTADSPVVDVSTTKIGTNLKGDALIGVPNSTDVWGALSEAPGVRMQGFDVGGSHKSQQSGYEVFGVQNQARVVSDGVDHTEGVGGTGFYEDYFANEEVSVSALGSDVEMNSPRRGRSSRRSRAAATVQGSGASDLRAGQLRRQQRRGVGHRAARLHVSAQRRRASAVQQPEPAVLGRAPRSGRSDRAGQGLVLRRLQPLQDRQGRLRCRRVGRDRSRNLRQLHRQGHGEGSARTTRSSATSSSGRKQKPKRGLSTLVPPESILAQDSWSTMYKGEWQSVRQQSRLPQRERRQLHARLADGAGGRSVVRGLPQRYRSTTAQGRRRMERVLDRPQEAAGEGAADLLPAREGRQPRFQVRVRGHCTTRTASASTAVAGRTAISYPGVAGAAGRSHPLRRHRRAERLRRRTGRSVPNIDQHYSGLRAGSLGAEQPAVDHAGVRIDYQDVDYNDAIRKPEIIDRRRAGRRRSSPRTPTVTRRARCVKQHGRRAAHRRQLRPDRQGPDAC